MANRLAPLNLFQIGREAPSGTAVAATSQLQVPSVEFDALDEIVRPQHARGYLIGNTGGESTGRRGTTWSIPEHSVNFQQIFYWLGSSIRSIAAPAASPAGVYTWVFDRPLTTVPIPETFTLERRVSDGAVNTDFEWPYAFVESWTLSGKQTGEIGLTVNGQARRRQNSTLTAGLFPSAVLIPTFSRSQLFIDASYANLGVTPVSLQMIDWSLQFDSGFEPQWSADNRADQDFSTLLLNARKSHFNFDATFYVSSQWGTELAQAELAGGLPLAGIRYIRLDITHPIVITGVTPYLLRFDMIAMSKQGSLVKLDEQDGQCIFRLSVTETPNGVNPWFAATIRNGQAAIT